MEENKLSIPKNYYIIVLGICAMIFVVGMRLEQQILFHQFDSHILKYNLKDGGYLVAPESFAAVYGNSSEMEKFYYQSIIPALKGFPVCFTNSNPILNITKVN